jgi:hypothetical protein
LLLRQGRLLMLLLLLLLLLLLRQWQRWRACLTVMCIMGQLRRNPQLLLSCVCL